MGLCILNPSDADHVNIEITTEAHLCHDTQSDVYQSIKYAGKLVSTPTSLTPGQGYCSICYPHPPVPAPHTHRRYFAEKEDLVSDYIDPFSCRFVLLDLRL